jgi:hypothetical protein
MDDTLSKQLGYRTSKPDEDGMPFALLRCAWDLLPEAKSSSLRQRYGGRLARQCVFRRFALPFPSWEEKRSRRSGAPLDHQVAASSEDRPEMMMTKPGKQHEEVVKLSLTLQAGRLRQLALLCFSTQCHGIGNRQNRIVTAFWCA